MILDDGPPEMSGEYVGTQTVAVACRPRGR